jgi:hypothetical protein
MSALDHVFIRFGGRLRRRLLSLCAEKNKRTEKKQWQPIFFRFVLHILKLMQLSRYAKKFSLGSAGNLKVPASVFETEDK